MQRNFHHRIEVVVPVESARARQETLAVLESPFSAETNVSASRRRSLGTGEP